MVELKNKTEVFIPESGQFCFGIPGDVFPLEKDFPGLRLVERPD